MRWPGGLGLVGGVLLCVAGCGSDPVDRAIRDLAGSESDRRQAMMTLRLTSGDVVPRLVEAVGDPGAAIRGRLAAAEVLADILERQEPGHGAGGMEALRGLLGASEARLRRAGAEILGRLGDEVSVPELVALKANDEDPGVRAAAAEGLEALGRAVVERLAEEPPGTAAVEAVFTRLREAGMRRGFLGYAWARFLEKQGRREEAQTMYERLGVIRRYWVLGTFPNRYGSGLHQAWPVEANPNPRVSLTVAGREVAWYDLSRDLPGGRLDFRPYFLETKRVTAYALTSVWSGEARAVELRLGSDDGVKVFLNDEEVFVHDVERGVEVDDDVVALNLRAGWNALLFKVTNDAGRWGLLARITGPGDTPLEGVDLARDPAGNEAFAGREAARESEEAAERVSGLVNESGRPL